MENITHRREEALKPKQISCYEEEEKVAEWETEGKRGEFIQTMTVNMTIQNL